MDYARVVVAALGATVVYFLIGGLLFTSPFLRSEYQRYPSVYRTQESMQTVWPVGIVGMLLSMLALATLYAWCHRSDSGLSPGLVFGALVGAFAVGSFVLHNYVNLNIGLRLTVVQAIAYFVEWLAVGVVIALIYRPPAR